MANLTVARAWCNNEVAYLVWKADGKIPGCLGFMITRIHVDTGERRILPTWVAFNTQSNPDWNEQDMSVWPVQKYSWRDLTLRRSRDSLSVRSGPLRVKYRIDAVGLKAPGRQPVPPSPTAHPGKYTGTPIPLFFCGASIETPEITVTDKFGDASAGFNNGILSTQFLRKQLHTKDGEAPSKAVVKKRIADKKDPLRAYLGGDVLPFLRRLFSRAAETNGTIYLALYELADPELIDLLAQHQQRLHLILCTAGKDKTGKVWDTTNTEARARLRGLMGDRLHDRMFNNSAHIGHNKFAVLVVGNQATAVWTGSVNWTPTGLCGQTNNSIILNSTQVADAYLRYWNRLVNDKLEVPKPLSSPDHNNQGLPLRQGNIKTDAADLDAGKTHVDLWYSPNTKTTGSPKTRTVPPDLEVVFRCMRQAKDAIFFLVFNPGRSDAEGEDVNTVVSAGIDFGRHDSSLLVMGAISDPTALPGYQAPPPAAKNGTPKKKTGPKIPLPAIFSPPGAPKVLMIRAAAISDLIGDFQKELLSAGTAIIHDKVVVIDPLSKKDCVVITGSHNLGFKASYANDENMVIVRGNQELALAYTVHVMDVYDHYKFRAAQEEQTRQALLKGKKPERAVHKGFLDTTEDWQNPYVTGDKGEELAYFLK